MAKPLDPGVVEIIQDCYKDDWKTIAIHEFFQNEFSLNIPYKTIWGRHPDVIAEKKAYRQKRNVRKHAKAYRKEYNQRPANLKRKAQMRVFSLEYNERSYVKIKRSILNHLSEKILEAYNGAFMTAAKVQENIEKKYNVKFGPDLENRIDEGIINFEKQTGDESPITRTYMPKTYKFNRTHYAFLCGKPIED